MSKTQNNSSKKTEVTEKQANNTPASKQGNQSQHRGNKNNRNRGKQGRKDSASKRVNFDNAREDKVAKQILADARSGKFNDINDFMRNPMLLKAAASIPVMPILGASSGTLAPVPGIMTFLWYPSFGSYQRTGSRAQDSQNPNAAAQLTLTPPPIALNQAADSTYSFIVHANSRNYNYNAPDLFMLILAGSQVFSIIQAMKRAFGLAKRYVETSLYCPDPLLTALGFDGVDLRHNLSQAWFDLNNLITQTRQIWVPSAFPIISRWMDMSSDVYKDADGTYAQLYAFVQGTYYIYDETALKTGGCLRQVTLTLENSEGTPNEVAFVPGENSYTWSQWVSVAQKLIDALINSEDRGIIYGDLLNAYTAERIIALPEIDSTYTVEPVYTPEISMQIENMVICKMPMPSGLAQFGNKLFPLYTTPIKQTQSYNFADQCPSNWSLNFHTTSDPTPEMFLLATRFMPLGTMQAKVLAVENFTTPGTMPSASNMIVPATCGSEVVFDARLYYSPGMTPNIIGQRAMGTGGFAALTMLQSMSFDWHPFFGTYPSTSASSITLSDAKAKAGTVEDTHVQATYGDQDRYTDVNWLELTKINDTAEFSLFGVPQL